MTTQTAVSTTELRAYKARVRDLIAHIVNDFGIKYRIIDGSHLLLYPVDGETRPFKASASRQEAQTLKFLKKFMDDNGLVDELPAPKGAVGDALAKAVEKKQVPPADTDPVVEGPKKRGPKPKPIPPAPDDGLPVAIPDGYERIYSKAQHKWTSFARNGDAWICLLCGHEGDKPPLMGSHMATKHVRPMDDINARRKQLRSRQEGAAKREALAKVTKAEKHVAALAEVFGVHTDTSGLEAEVARLTEKVTALTAERDDLKAKLALIKEAWKA